MGKELITKVSINASPAKVWQVLTDFAKYNEWNPFLIEIHGKAATGERLNVKFANGWSMTPQLIVVEPEKELRWQGKLAFGGLFDGEHRFILTPTNGGASTELEHAEKFSGILIPLLSSMLADTKVNFEKMNVALDARCKA